MDSTIKKIAVSENFHSANSAGSSNAKAVPNYLRASTSSCHHACKYGGRQNFEEQEARKIPHKAREHSAAGGKVEQQREHQNPEERRKRSAIKIRSLSQRRGRNVTVEDDHKSSTEWKDIVCYDAETKQIPAKPANSSEGEKEKKKQVVKAKKLSEKAEIEQENVSRDKHADKKKKKKFITSVRSKLTGKSSTDKKMTSDETQFAKRAVPPSHKNDISSGKKSASKTMSPNLPTPPRNARVARSAEEKMEKGAPPPTTAKVKPEETTKSSPASPSAGEKEKNQEKLQESASDDKEMEYPSSKSSTSIPVFRKAKSMSVSSQPRRTAFVRQASKNPAALKLRSKSSKAAAMPTEGDNPVKLRFRRAKQAGDQQSGIGIQLRRSLRRRGVGVAVPANADPGLPVVVLRHQKTLEKKKSRRLYNNLIEETANSLVKTRKSRVKALVGAFETIISKIGK